MKKNYFRKKNTSSSDATIKATPFFKNIAVIVLFLFGFHNAYSQTVTYITGSGNFTVPCDVTSITVEIWGGGGAGGGGNNNNNGGSGGGAGGYSTATLSVTAGSTIAYSVGGGGTGNNNTGNTGGITTFGALTANGGSGGGPNQGAIGVGGTASGGTTNISGSNGNLGTSILGAAGGNANGGGGAGGASRNTAGAGNPGTIPGGGGGGGFRTTATNRAGGDGARGEIRITYSSSLFVYCSPTFTSSVEPITNVTFAGINNTTSNTTGGTVYLESFCNTATVTQGQTVPISVKGNTAGNFTDYFRLYVDWNKNGTFGDVGTEIYDLGTITNSTGIDAVVLSTSIVVPAGASLGLTRMRLMKRFFGYPTAGAAGACQTGAGYGQAEDYCVNVIGPPTITSLSATSGCVGSSLIITGTNLSGATAASIGGTGAAITANTATSITLTVGSGTTGTVSVTTPGGTATSAASFTVNPLPAAISGAATVCIGGTITLTDATVGGTWGITNGTGSATISATGDVTGVTSGTVTASYTLPTTCSITKVVTVQQPPGAIAGGSTNVCENSSTPAFTNPVAGGTWTVTNGTGTATITSPGGVLTGTAAGTVTVNYTIGSCTPATFSVTVDPTPVAISGAATVCTGTTTTLTDATAGGTWGITNGTGSATISATGDVTGVTAGTVTASYTLSPTTCNVTKSITVQQTPGAISGGAATVCEGTSTPAFTNPNAGGTWSVTNGTGTANITVGGVLSGITAGTVTVNYTIGSCVPATFAVTVIAAPVAIVGTATVCTGATTTYTNAVGGGTWSVTNGTGTATITAGGDVSGATAGTVTINYAIGTCSVTKGITVQQTPGAIAGGSSSVCVGSSTPAFTNPNGGGTWSVTNGTGTATIAGTGILTGVTAGTVTVNYTIGLCTAATFPVTVNPLPAAISGAATLCTGTTTTFSDATAGGTWSITNGTGTASITNPGGVVTPGTTGTVTVVYTLPTTCNVTKALTIQQTPGANAGGATTVCAGYTTPAFTNPNAGGTWSVTNGTGSATIAGTGILTGVTAGTVTVNYTIGSCTPATSSVTINPTPAAPTLPVNSLINNSGFTVTWTASAGAVNYVLEVYTDPARTIPAPGSPFTVASPTVTYTVTGLNIYTPYYYRIKATNATCSSAYLLGTVTTTIVNDNCTNATALTVNPTSTCTTSTNSTTVNATQSLVGCGGSNADDDVWFSFVATGTTHTVTVTPISLNNAVLEVFSGNCSGLSSFGCVNNTGGSNAEITTLTGLTSGFTYYVRVNSNGNAANTGTFTICVTSPPVNNQCANATSLPCGTTNLAGTTIGTVSYTNNSTCTMSDYGVWYTFVGDGNTNIISVTTSGYDIEMAIASGTCGALTNVTCQDSYTGTATETYTFNAVLGTTYYVYVAYYAAGTTTGNFTISRACLIPPVNDNCSGAIPLTVSTNCSYSTYTTVYATDSGIADPGCANYSGGDVWFSAVVPATGELDIDLQAGVMTDSGIAIYSGTCGSLTLLDCDDDSGAGAMSSLSRTGLTPGQTIYIRVWEYGNDNDGTFGICVTTPSCPSPSDLFANILSTTSVTVNWTASSPPASGGYQYFINTTGTPPTAGSTPTGTTLPGVINVTFTGLTPGLKYYFWVRSFCGGTDVSTWFGPTNYTPCAVGNGTGTTTLGCTSPIAGGLGLSGVDPAALSCSALTCPTLEVSYLPLKQTTDYTVSSITYSPPYQFTCLQNPVSVNVDDIWSPTVNLPFNFCFYGNNYNKCLIGSNGVITFDTTNNTPGGYSTWSFNTNLPNTSLFKNSIFGVYHDIDPSKGGQVGWELITLNTGCRALVASWNDIPMYSAACNSSYYTGMMVLYENTNVIEVYIKEKNVCSTWNSGNAIVGVQNSAGTAAVVAPGRNGLDTNWAVTNEAWRFTPNGPSINPTVQWYQGNVATGTPIPGPAGTSSTVTVCPTITTTYTAEVTYPLCTGNLKVTDVAVVTVNGNKIWNGSTDTNWNVGSNWTPSGVPTNTNCVVVPVVGNGRYPLISATPDAVGYNLAVYSNASLTVGANQNLTITDKITVQSPSTGAFTVNNNANLIQINDAAVNTGSIFYKRIAPNIKGSDYVYWSSPVLNQNMGTIYDTGTQGYRYQWNPILNNGNGASGNISQGFWEAASGIMDRARGYIIRGFSYFGMPASSIPVTFNGTPFNGIIPYTVQRGSYTGAPYNGANGVPITNLNDNYNLLGNPYPSSINALKFLQLNTYDVTTNPTGQILGNVKLWLHGIDPTYGAANPFYGSYLYNYSANDYLTLNYLGSTTPSVADIIKAGQAFFVQMVDGATGSGTVNFNNSMRYDGSTLPYNNSNFFKSANTTNSEFSLERNRIWLDLVDANSQSSRILLGYATNATNNYDPLFDAITAVPSGLKLFSMIEDDNEVYEIQGKSLPFDVNDEIPIGIKAPTQGNYTFAIAAVDGLFDTQNIYLKDNLLNITHDLKANPYHFTSTSGAIKDRFKIVYIDNALGTIDYSLENNIKVMTNEQVSVSSNHLQMESIVVYNVLSQQLATYKGINSNYFTLSNLHKNNTTLLLKIKLQTGETVIKKIIY